MPLERRRRKAAWLFALIIDLAVVMLEFSGPFPEEFNTMDILAISIEQLMPEVDYLKQLQTLLGEAFPPEVPCFASCSAYPSSSRTRLSNNNNEQRSTPLLREASIDLWFVMAPE